MRASYKWLKELSGVTASAEELAEKLTDIGLEVEALIPFTAPERIVVGEIRKREKHPKKDKLSIVRVFDGTEEHEVICGAPNVPDPGGRILFAQLGAKLELELGVLEIAERKIAGVVSRGMICSESELNIGSGQDGIFVFAKNAPEPGTPLRDALPVGDVAFEIGLTPNRPDCLGHVGIARDIAAAYGVPFEPPAAGGPPTFAEGAAAVTGEGPQRFPLPWTAKGPEVALDDVKGLGPVQVSIADPDRCPRYGAAFVLGVKVQPSPFWLRYRLHVLGHRSLSNLVDATNLVMLEWGHPIHGFDLEKLRGRRIDVRLAKSGEKTETLDGVERELEPDDLLICDGEGPVAIAGVMGGANSEIGDATKNVAIECAYFDARSVRRTSRRLGMHTDASHRFERGVDPNAVPAVLARASALIAQLGGGVALAEAIDVHPKPTAPVKLSLRRDRLSGLLGVEVPEEVPPRALAALGCEVEPTEDGWRVQAPTWRPDIGREADLIEEVGRIYGYSHIPTVVPRVAPSRAGTPSAVLFERRLREAAAAVGLHEAVSYSFVARSDLERARVSTKTVALSNPLSEERSVMRTSLLPGLAASASVALRRQVPEVALFEVGTVFGPSDDVLPREQTKLGVLLAGRSRRWLGDEAPLDFYDLKGIVEALVLEATGHGANIELLEEQPRFLHPRRLAAVKVAQTQVGVLGELHPDVGDALELDVRALYAELDVATLQRASEAGAPQAAQPPRFPAVIRDMALLVSAEHPARAVEKALKEGAGPLLESVTIFDLYQGQGVPEGSKSLAFRLVYRDLDSTLTDKAVDKAHRAAAAAAEKRLGATLR